MIDEEEWDFIYDFEYVYYRVIVFGLELILVMEVEGIL